MSNELVRLAWKTSMPTGPKFVLIALADAANREGKCWPKREQLAAMTNINKSTVSEHLKWLRDRGFVAQKRGRQEGATYVVSRSALIEAQEVGNPDLLIDEDTGQREVLRAVDSNQEVGNQDILNPDLLNQEVGIQDQEVGNPDIPKENPQLTPTRRGSAEGENPDARKLCELLGDLMYANGNKRPSITARTLNEARLLLERDKRALPEAIAVLEWSQADSFWQDNIHSITKFRKQYDQLRGKAAKAGALQARVPHLEGREQARAWLLAQWESGAVAEVMTLTGLRWEAPDLPLGITGKREAEEFFRAHRKQWIKDNHELIISRLLGKSAA